MAPRAKQAIGTVGTARGGGPVVGRSSSGRSPSLSPHSAAHPQRRSAVQPSSRSSEIAELLQLATQTLLQTVPPSPRVDIGSITVPTSLVSSLLANLQVVDYAAASLTSDKSVPAPPPASDDYDLVELLQTLGDIVSPFAFHWGVEIIVGYSDITFPYCRVSGDRLALLFTLTHLMRGLISTSSPGDLVEVGLSSGSIIDEKTLFHFDISHHSAVSPPFASVNNGSFHRTLKSIGASFSTQPMTSYRSYLFSVPLKPLSTAVLPNPNKGAAAHPPVGKIKAGPEVEGSPVELGLLIEGLKGKKVALYANTNTRFAEFLTTHLTAWGMNIAAVGVDRNTFSSEMPLTESSASHNVPQSTDSRDSIPNVIIIDDDIEELNRRIADFRRPNYSASRRPPLIHRPKSLHRNAEANLNREPTCSCTIIYLTSPQNFTYIRNLASSIDPQGTLSLDINPLLKPVGSRRLLMALSTLITKDAAPSSASTTPTITPVSSPYPDYSKSRTPPESRPRLEKTLVPSSHVVTGAASSQLHIGLPLATELDASEYFPSTGPPVQGPTSSSGVLVKGPDGHTTGIFFQPPAPKPRQIRPSDTTNPPHRQSADAQVEKPKIPQSAKQPKTQSNTPGMHPVESPPSADEQTSFIKGDAPQRPGVPSSINQTDQGTAPSAKPSTGLITHAPSLSPLKSTGVNSNLKDNVIVPPINVLIVEDNPINQSILATFMKRKKIKYDTAKDGQEAIDKFRSGNFHLILMDIQMPVMDGIMATREIRRIENEAATVAVTQESQRNETTTLTTRLFRSSVIIVALTALSLESDRDNALAAGCNDFLTKPVSLVWLNSKIIEWGSLKALQMYANSIRKSGEPTARKEASPSREQSVNETAARGA